MSNEINQCTICGKDADKKCSRCKKVAYCSKECQAGNWKTHKYDCQNVNSSFPNIKLYECAKIEGKGDGLRANTDIKYGTVIIVYFVITSLTYSVKGRWYVDQRKTITP